MKHFYPFILLFAFCCLRCTTEKEVATNAGIPDSLLTMYYVYDPLGATENPIDSVLMVRNDFEKSLLLHQEQDTLNKLVEGQFFFRIVKLEDQKFAFLSDDSLTRVYQWGSNGYQRIFTLPELFLGIEMSVTPLEVNGDGYQDLVLQSASGGTHGDDYALFLFHPQKNTLVFDPRLALYNIDLDPANHMVGSNTRFSSTLYEIKDFAFKMVQESHLMQEDPAKVVVTDFDSVGNVVAVDTTLAEDRD